MMQPQASIQGSGNIFEKREGGGMKELEEPEEQRVRLEICGS